MSTVLLKSGNWSRLTAAGLRALADKLEPKCAPIAVEISDAVLADLEAINDLGRVVGVRDGWTGHSTEMTGECGTFIVSTTMLSRLKSIGVIGQDCNITEFGHARLRAGEVGVFRQPQKDALLDVRA
ncbi:hypothetical protein DES40_1746 [Litorimonas taeanensis]|uniref:Uncharacterized protein n=1 Tax=Litorimonas taeanensis TaxID=568099 RepID=A0A420WDH8_9PROT|nr:hypothetical protein [Litorimonas taeanensis]RKQ68970.1 hypothetical protein DES40_1746 [Litorimonas taeanensis]